MKNTFTRIFSITIALLCSTNGYSAVPDCKDLCFGKKNSPYCLVLPKREVRADAMGILRTQFSDQTIQLIRAKELLQWFRVETDPCNRSGTSKLGNEWTNKGSPCIISAEVTLIGKNRIALQLHMPEVLSFRVDSMDAIQIISVSGDFPMLQIADGNLHNDWGGAIKIIYSSSDKAVFQMPRGCLVAPFN
jgi:hypothetical protein